MIFSIGDVVRLKSGGPLLTVDDVHNDYCVAVVWFVGDEVRRDGFDAAELALAVATPRARYPDDTPIDETALSVGLRRNLRKAFPGATVGTVRALSDMDLIRTPQLGRKRLNEIRDMLGREAAE